MKYRRVLLVSVLIISTVVFAAWIGGNFTGGAGIGATLAGKQSNDTSPAAASGDSHISNLYLVEFGQTPGQKQLSTLTGLVLWAGNLTGNTITVRADSEQLESIQKLSFVKKVSPYPAGKKLSEELTGNKTPGTATGDKPAAGIAGGDSGFAIPGRVEVVVTLVTPGDKPAAEKLIASLGGRVTAGAGEKDQYLRAELSAAALDELANSPLVLYIESHWDAEFLNDRSRDITGARPVAIPGFVTAAGLTGAGQTIGLADSGLDTGNLKEMHADLRTTPGKKPRVVMLKSWAGVEKPVDNIGHGTHMAGTLVGSGASSNGKYAGLAPEASLYFQGVVDEKGRLALPVNLESLYRPAYDASVRVHVNGWGRKVNRYTSAAAQVDAFVRNNPDFLAVFGAGNFGPDKNTITAEANSKNALVVGATANPRPALDPENTDTSAAVDFSSCGPAADGRIKPELLAPGTSVISTASSALGGNLPEHEEYSVMQGTSMASAVAGGSAALLRQYFQGQPGTRYPSAALLKAALVNGAGPVEGDPGSNGFGVLNLAKTVISLKEELMLYDDNYTGLVTGQFTDYEYEVTNSGVPLKATLAWSDPAAAPGARKALVNDLDLLIITPRGERYFGNHRLRPENRRDRPDDINNVEQVYIPDPLPGKYTIRIYGRSVTAPASLAGAGLRQDYAVVYGQPAPAKEVEGFDDKTGRVFTVNGEHYNVADNNVLVALNDGLSRVDSAHVMPGSRLYTAGENLYLVTRFWRGYGLELKKTTRGLLWDSDAPGSGDGGYLSDRTAVITVNGDEYSEEFEPPPGFEAGASVDPLTQVIRVAQIRYSLVEGFIEKFNTDENTVKLLKNNKIFQLSDHVSYLYNDRLVNTDPVDAAFGPATADGMEKLVRGTPVRLVIAPSASRVQAIAIKRTAVVGTVEAVDPDSGTVNVNGREYKVFPGAEVVFDNKPAELEDIKPGGLATLFLFNDRGDVSGLKMYSNSITGRVDYLQASEGVFYLGDSEGKSHQMKLDPDTVVTRWGTDNGPDALTEGLWARVILSPDGERVLQVQCAETLREKNKKLAYYNEEKQSVTTSDGVDYYLGALSEVSKSGFPLPAGELVPGDSLDIVSLLVPGSTGRAVLELEARPEQYLATPRLNASGVPFESDFWVTGNTTGNRLYLYHGPGKFKKIDLTADGQFAFSYLPPDGEHHIYLVTVAGDTGAVTGTRVNLAGGRSRAFTDLAGHWAEADLNAMAAEGLIAGYPGNRFLPGQTVTRVEFTAMLARAFGWYSTRQDDLDFTDSGDIPRWARQAVAGAAERRVVAGYPDGTFRPLAPVTRVEEAAILARILAIHGLEVKHDGEEDCFPDFDKIPAWARESVRKACAAGIVKGRGNNRFEPDAPATRAETAVTIYRLLQTVRNSRSN